MTATRVLVIGCGIAGPVLSIFLKRKGYDPVLFERLDGSHDAGLALMLQPNGLKVLSLVPGLRESMSSSSVGLPIERIGFFSLLTNPPTTLGTIENITSTFTDRYGHGMVAVSRSAFQQFLVECAQKEGIEIKWGWQLDSIEEVKGPVGEDEVLAIFANGEKEKGSFIVGCDGLHSGTRIALFGKENPDYTGVAQIGGVAPTPVVLKEKHTLANISHVNIHMVTYPISATHSAWAISSAESEAKESWRAIDEKKRDEIKSSSLSELQYGAGDLVKGSEKIIKYGLYDRPQLSSWHKGRVVLLGDAAHPATPHLGQGANQALEDVYHLVLQLTKNHPSASASPTNEQLTAAFTAYESIRLPRSAEIVRSARKRGVLRVQADEQAAKERDERFRRSFLPDNFADRLTEYDNVGRFPFEGESELVLS